MEKTLWMKFKLLEIMTEKKGLVGETALKHE